MAKSKRELLITLGADTTTFSQKIKRATDLTKEMDSNFKLLSSSSKDFEKTIQGVGAKQDYLTDRVNLFNKKSEVYVEQLKQQQEMLENVSREQQLYSRQQKAMATALEKLEGTKAYEVLSVQLKNVDEQLQKANKQVRIQEDKIISLNRAYNVTQTEIQGMVNELTQLDEKMENLKSDETFAKMKDDIKESQRAFNNLKASTGDFGSTMKDLTTIQSHYESQLEKNKNLMMAYSNEMSKSNSKIEKMENYVDELTKELREYENALDSMKSTDENFDYTSKKVEELRKELTSANNILNNHRERLEDVNKEYKSVENEVASLTGSVLSASKSISKMEDSVTFEKTKKEITYLNDTLIKNLSKKLNELKEDFNKVENTTDDYSGSMEGLGNRFKALKNMFDVTKKSIKAYNEQLESLGEQSSQVTTEIKKVEKSLDYYKQKLETLDKSNGKWDETNNKIKDLNNTHKELTAQLKALESATAKGQQGLKSITQESIRLSSSMQQTKDKMDSLDNALTFEKAKEEIDEFNDKLLVKLNNKLKETKDEFEKVSNGVVSLDNSMEGLGTKVEYYNNIMKQTNKVIKEYTNQTQQITDKNKELSKELSRVQKNIEKIENTRSQNKGTKEWDKQVKSLEKYNQRYVELTTTIDKNNAKISDNEKKINALSNEYYRLGVNVEKTKSKMNNLTEGVKIESVTKEVSYFNDYTIKRLSENLSKAKQDFKELSQSTDNLENSMDGLDTKLKSLENILELTNKTASAYEKQISSLLVDQNKLETEISETENALKEYKSTLSSLEGTKAWDEQKVKIDELNNKHKELVSELGKVNNKLSTSKKSFDDLNSEMKTLGVNVEKTKTKMQSMKDAVSFKSMEREIKSLSDKAVERLNNEIGELQDNLNLLETKTSKASNSTHTLTQKSELLGKIIKKNKDLGKEYSTELEKTTTEVKRLTTESAKLETKLKSQEKLLKSDKLNSDNWEKQRKQFEELTKQYNEVNKELKEYTSKQENLRSQYKQTENNIKSLTNQLSQNNNELEEQVEKQKKLENQQKQTTNALKNLNLQLSQNKFKTMEDALESVRHETELLGSRMDLLRSKYVNFETSISGAVREKKLLKQQTKELRTEFELQKAVMEQYKSELTALISKETSLQNSIKDTKLALKSMNDEVDKINATTELTKMEMELESVNGEIKEVTNSLREMELQSNSTLTQINTNIATQSRTWETLSGRVQQMGGAFQSLGNSMQSLGGFLTPVTVGVTAMGGAIIKTGVDFQAQIQRLGALSGKTGDELKSVLKELEEGARDLGATTRYSATEASQGLEDFMLAGYSAEKAIKALPIAVQMATADNIELSESTELLVTALSSLGNNSELTGDELKDLSIIANQMAVNANATTTDMAGLARSFVKVGGQAENLKMPLSTTGTFLGILGDKGVYAEEAGNALSSILINLTQTTGQSADAMKELGISAFDSEKKIRPMEEVLVDLKKKLSEFDGDEQEVILKNMLGGKVQAKTLMKLLQGIDEKTGGFTEKYKNLKAELEKAPDLNVLQNMVDQSNDTLKNDLFTLKSTIEDSFLTIYKEIEPVLREVTQKATEFIRELTKKFQGLDDATQKNIIKFVALAGVLAPVLSVFGFMITGIGTTITVFGKFIGITGKVVTKLNLLRNSGVTLKGIFTNFGGTMKTLGSFLKGGFTGAITKITALFGGGAGLSGILGTLSAVALPAIAVALTGLSVIFGDNEQALSSLIDKFGWLGTAMSGVVEFVNGIFKSTFGQAGNLLGGIGKTIGAVFTGDFKNIDDIWSETWSNMKITAGDSWENITMTSTRSINKLRDLSSKDLGQIKKIFEDTYGEISKTTSTNVEQVATNFTNMFADSRGKTLDLAENTIDILRGTSDTMRVLFAGVKSEMDIDVAKARFTENLNNLLNTGGTTAEQLAKDFEVAWATIDTNIVDGGERLKTNAENVLGEFATVATGKVDQGVNDIVDILDGLDSRGIESLRGIGTNWNAIFADISTSGKMSTEEMKEKILANIERLGLDTPEKLQQFKNTLKTELDLVKEQTGTDGQEIGTKLLEGVETGTTEGAEGTGETIKNTTKQVTEKAVEGAKEGFVQLPESIKQELAKAGVTINEQGNVIVSDMAQKGKEGASAYVQQMDAEMPKLSKVTKTVQKQLDGIDKVKFGNVTKQLSEINRWLGVVQSKAIITESHMRKLTSLPFGNTTKALSEVNNWLMRTTNRSNDSRNAMIKLTNLPFGNTTKGLSEVNKWLKDRVTPSAVTAHSKLLTLSKFTFSGVVSGLKSVNSWLSTIQKNAGKTRSSILAVANARTGKAIETQQVITPEYDLNKLTRDSVIGANLALYKTTGGFYEPSSIATPKVESVKADSTTDALLRATLEQNQLLLQLLNQQKPVEVAVNMDGRQVAKASAKYMENEINLINSRKARLGGK